MLQCLLCWFIPPPPPRGATTLCLTCGVTGGTLAWQLITSITAIIITITQRPFRDAAVVVGTSGPTRGAGSGTWENKATGLYHLLN